MKVITTKAERGKVVMAARASERNCRLFGLYDAAVVWQQYADSIEKHGEVYTCEMMRRTFLGDAPS